MNIHNNIETESQGKWIVARRKKDGRMSERVKVH